MTEWIRKYLFACVLSLAVPLLPVEGLLVAGCSLVGVAWAEGLAQAASGPPAAPNEKSLLPEAMRTSPTTTPLPTGLEGPVPPAAPLKPDELRKDRVFFDVLHSGLSREILSTATWLDSFFGDERAVMELNRSYLRVRYEAFQEERTTASYRPSFDMRLVLPQMQKKTHLVISSEPTEPTKGGATPLTPAGERITVTEEKNATAALDYLFRLTDRESFIMRTGAQFAQGKPVLFIQPRYRLLLPLNSWDFRFTQEEMYRTDTGWQVDSRFDLERQYPHDLFFRTSLGGVWYGNRNGYFYNLVFSLRQVFQASRAMDYEWINSYQTRPVNELAEIAFRIRYRQSFWREWLFFEVAPQVRFPRDGNYDMVPGILFRLEAFFGTY